MGRFAGCQMERENRIGPSGSRALSRAIEELGRAQGTSVPQASGKPGYPISVRPYSSRSAGSSRRTSAGPQIGSRHQNSYGSIPLFLRTSEISESRTEVRLQSAGFKPPQGKGLRRGRWLAVNNPGLMVLGVKDIYLFCRLDVSHEAEKRLAMSSPGARHRTFAQFHLRDNESQPIFG